MSLVDDWSTIGSGTPYVATMGTGACVVCGGNPVETDHADILFTPSTGQGSSSEKIGQTISLPTDSDKLFWIEFDGASGAPPLDVKFDIGSTPIRITVTSEYDVCNSGMETYETICFSKPALGSAFNISIEDADTLATLHIDNVKMFCKSEDLLGIDVQEISDCEFRFSADVATGSPLTITSYLWDFGDGDTSTSANPVHEYDDEGTYVVTLTIEDDEGCCTTVEMGVTCGDMPCLYYICWNEIQEIRYVQGVTTDAGTHEFSQDGIVIQSHYQLIQNLMLAELDLDGADYGTFMEEHMDYTCSKDTYPLPGYFFMDSDVEFETIYGLKSDLTMISIDFNSAECN